MDSPKFTVIDEFRTHESIFETEKFKKLCEQIMQDTIIKEESIIHHVLTQHLQMRPTEEDFKKCIMKYREGYPDNYLFTYDHMPLGWIKKAWVNKEYIIQFNPIMAKKEDKKPKQTLSECIDELTIINVLMFNLREGTKSLINSIEKNHDNKNLRTIIEVYNLKDTIENLEPKF